ncbi:hypothetical protein SRRS_03430 [Sporomusa rhizae]|uniref:hypothetical protein n=1 Tax=Sporomusa rhizae TaxID=357999 RepID=UPI00352A8743
MRQVRREKAHITFYNTAIMHRRSPGLAAWWSAAFPGFGHIYLGCYIKGYFLIIWEFIVNLNSNLNMAIIYAFTGRFELSATIIDTRWLLMYCPMYIFGIWGSYRLSLEFNKVARISRNGLLNISPQVFNGMGANILDKRLPYITIIWSMLMPGIGHIYITRLVTGLIIMVAWVTAVYFSGFLPAFHLTLIGDFSRVAASTNPQWLLFLPSLYCFTLFDSYSHCVEYNKLFDQEQAQFLESEYQDGSFKMPI